MLWAVLIFGALVGVIGGWRSLRLARSGNLPAANRFQLLSALIAGICGFCSPCCCLGGPFKAVSVTVEEEVHEQVIEMITVPRWVVLGRSIGSKTEPVSVDHVTKIPRTETRRDFSAGLLLLLALSMFVGGVACFVLERAIVRLIWRTLG